MQLEHQRDKLLPGLREPIHHCSQRVPGGQDAREYELPTSRVEMIVTVGTKKSALRSFSLGPSSENAEQEKSERGDRAEEREPEVFIGLQGARKGRPRIRSPPYPGIVIINCATPSISPRSTLTTTPAEAQGSR
jgi:hypothetical protein